MPRLDLPPTKSSLRRIRQELSFAYEGFDLLNQKRDLLAAEIVRRAAALRESREALGGALEELYRRYRMAAADMGSDALVLKSRSELPRYRLRALRVTLMGLGLPRLALRPKKMKKCSGFAGTTARYDLAKQQCLEVLPALADYGAAAKALMLLARELKKVQRRVNALEKIFIPRHEEAAKYIGERLEEIEREEVFVKKLIRQKAGSR